MNRSSRFAATLAVFVAFAAAPAFAQEGGARLSPGEPIPPAELEAFVDGFVTEAMQEHGIVGATVSVVQYGEVLLAKGYGFADLETGRRVDPDRTLFRIGSITKTFTWIAIMRLVEEGRIALDDPVNDHLPPELQVPDQGFDEPIRVRDLMTHQPGFEDRTLGVLFVDEPRKIRSLTEFLRATMPGRVRAPGEVSSYSNHGAALAGAIVEHETGQQWQDVIEAEILAPLSMNHTSTREPYPPRAGLPAPTPEMLAKDASVGFRRANGAAQAQGYEYITQIAPAGSMSSTASDMARYMLMQLGDGELGGARIYSSETARTFRTPMTTLPPEVGNWAGGFVDTLVPSGIHVYGHDGGTLAFFSNMIVVPQIGLGVFVSTNTSGGAALSAVLPGAIGKQFYEPPTSSPLSGMPEQRASMAEYAGAYLPTRRTYGGLAGFIGRLQAVPIAVSADGYLTLAAPPQGAQRFVPTDTPDLFRNSDGPGVLMFERRDGRLRILTVGIALEKLSLLGLPQVLIFPAVLTALASLAAIVGIFMRVGRTIHRSSLQARAAQLQIGAAVLWLVSLICAGVFAAGAASNPGALVYDWPPVLLVAFSTFALLASLASTGGFVLLPAVWRAEGGWSAWRKTRFTMTALIFAALGLLLLSWGALQPWNP